MPKDMEVQPLFDEKPESVANTPAALIHQAVANGSDLTKLEKLLELQERWETNEAKKSYHKAMAAFKANPPDIEKDKKVSFGNTKYSHATLANVVEKINAALSKHGLSASWMVNQNGTVSVTCKITHVQGHHEETTLSAPADNSGSKNSIQAIGSTITYLQRYTLLALTGLATHDMDDDGIAASGATPPQFISDAEAAAIKKSLAEIGSELNMFLSYMGVKSLGEILQSDLKKAQIAIETARKKRAVKK